MFDDIFSSSNAPSVSAPLPVVAAAAVEAPADPIPWQLTPASAASRAQGEQTIVVEKPSLGHVRGTEKALAQIDQPIVPFARNGAIVRECKDAFDPQAKKAGAYFLEAAAAGPERRNAQGRTQQVFFRIFYANPEDHGVEVRQASIACTVGKGGKLLRASVV